MIVDDAAFMRMMLKNILTKGGCEICDEAQDGLQAVEKFVSNAPDLTIMDITMPNMDGIEALKKIKSLNAGAKIIMCSAMGQEAMVVEAIKSGAMDFIVKPFQGDRLLAAIARVMPS
jgi:two-component system chemotaxis response regulator CheY